MDGPWLDTNLSIYLACAASRSHRLNRGRLAWFLAVPELIGGRNWHSIDRLTSPNFGANPAVFSGMAAGNGWVRTARPGGYGAVRFAGSDLAACASVSAQDLFVLVGGDVTVGAWIYPTSASGSKVIASWYQTAFNTVFDFYLKAGVLTWWDGAAERNSAISPAQNAWTYVAGSRAGTTLTFVVVSGGTVSTATSAVASSTANAAVLTIGADNNPNGWVGDLDDISVWNRALSIGELVEYADLSRRGYPGLLNRINPAFSPASATVAAAYGAALLPAM